MKVKSKRISRRKFLVGSAVGSLGLSGCAALDRYFEIEKFRYEREVLIFGAGVSGLSAAYYLKKNKIPYRIFEASSRTGGRILTQHSSVEGQYFDLGAYQFDENDHHILSLVKDLNLDFDEGQSYSPRNGFAFIHNQMLFPFRQVMQTETKSFQEWNKALIKLKAHASDNYDWMLDDEVLEFEKISFSEVLRQSKLGLSAGNIFKSWAEYYYQTPEKELTYLQWLLLLEKQTLKNNKIKIKNGMEELTSQLTRRVSGVIPNYNLQMPAKLIEIQRSNENWLCQIQTPEGIKKISSPYVVLALPFSQLKEVKGIENLFVNKELVSFIQSAQNQNQITVLAEIKNKNIKRPKGFTHFQCVDKKAFAFRLENNHAILNFNDLQDFEWFLNDRNNVFNFASVKDFQFLSSIDWSQIKFIHGSKVKLPSNKLISFKKSLDADWTKTSLQLAGDYLAHPSESSVNESIASAKRAVENIITSYKEKFKEA